MALKFFSPKEAEILEILIARMVGIDQPDVFKRSPTSEGQSIDYAPTVIIDDFVAKLPEGLRAPGNEPSTAKDMDIQMLVYPGGMERTEDEYRDLFQKAGFELSRITPTASPVSVIEGRPTTI